MTAGDNDKPTANAGLDQTVNEGAPVTLAGSGTDLEGDAIASYLWSGPHAALLNDDTAQAPTFTAPEQLKADTPLVFSLTVTDDRSATSATPDTVTITVTAGDNDKPTANAGPDQTVNEGTPVTLAGSGTDLEGDAIASYLWSGPHAVLLNDDTTQAPTFTAPEQLKADTPLVFSLTVTDDRGATSATPDTVTITVTAGENDAPTAIAGPDQTVNEGDPVTLAGSGTDPENDAITGYLWIAPDNVTLTDADTATPTFTAPEQLKADTPLVFSLTVTDDRGATSATPDTVTITVTAGDNDKPTANAGLDQTVNEGTPVTLAGSGTDLEGDAIASYLWSGPHAALLNDDTAQAPTFTAPEQLKADTPLVFSLTVTDDRGATSATPDTVTITVTAGDNDKPTANAGLDQTVNEGAPVTLAGSGTDLEGDAIASYLWSGPHAVLLNDDTTQAPTFTAPEQLKADTPLVFSLTVTDDRGATSATPDTVTITVTAGDNDTPTAIAGPAQTVAEGATVTLAGSGSDPEGDAIVRYLWIAPDSVTLDDASSATPSFIAPAQLVDDLELSFSLTVTDARGAVSVNGDNTLTITVTAGDNDTPTAIAGPAQTVAEGATVTLAGSGSDPEGDAIVRYLWIAPDSVTLDDASSATPSFIAPAQLVDDLELTFRLTVTDARGAVSVNGDNTLTITVTAGDNDTPTAIAGPAQTVAEGATVTLAGSGSDPEGDAIVRYLWIAPDSVTLDDASSATPSFIAPAQLVDDLELSFRLTVTDARGAVSVNGDNTLTITVTAGDNDTPTAIAGPAQTVAEGATVTLAGSGSDPEGDAIVRYLWIAPDSVTLDDASSATPSFIAPAQLVDDLELSFRLTVTDARGAVSVNADNTLTITVTAGDNDTPTAIAGPAQTVAEGATVTLAGSGSDPEGDAIVRYLWIAPDSVTLDDASSATPSFIAPAQLVDDLELTFRLTVTDARGAVSVNGDNTLTITVTAGDNDTPTAIAGPAQTVAEGATVTLAGSGSDPEGDAIVRYLWIAPNSVTLDDASSATPSFIAPAQLVDDLELTFSLTVTDARSAVSVNADNTLTITVTAGDNDTPTAIAGPAQTVAEGATVTLAGSGSDPEGDAIVRYLWIAPNSVTLDDASSATPSFIAPAQLVDDLELSFSLTVTDARGGVSVNADNTLTITVTAGDNDTPTAIAGPAQTVAEGATVTLAGSGSDPEGDAIVRYLWIAPDSVTLDDASSATPSFIAPAQLVDDLELSFSLTVTDARGAVSVNGDNRVTITVTAGDNDTPTANRRPGPDRG